jgi:hypothetical protein
MELIATIKEFWSWVGLNPVQVVGDNAFGNLIIKDAEGRYWRLSPEEPTCNVIAQSRTELDALSHDQTFLHGWYMRELVSQARASLGSLRPGYKYGLKIPALLGGEYGGSNLASTPLQDLVSLSGTIAKQIAGLPDGAKVRLIVTE